MKPKSGLREIVAVMLAVSLNPPLHACDTATLTVFPSVLCKGDQATITASIPCNSTIEPAFRILGVDWDFDSDGTVDATTADLSVLHTFSTPGCDNVSVTVRGTNDASFGSYCATGSKEYSVAEVTASAPDLWDMLGLVVTGYSPTVDLTVSAPDCQYGVEYVFVFNGDGRVDFAQGFGQGYNPVTLVSTAASAEDDPNDIDVVIKFNGVQLDSCRVTLTVRTPYMQHYVGMAPSALNNGWQSIITYQLVDQMQTILPAPIYWNEDFTTGVQSVWNDPITSQPSNWLQPAENEGITTQNPAAAHDILKYGCTLGQDNCRPVPLSPIVINGQFVAYPPNGEDQVDEWDGVWHVGSATTGQGVYIGDSTWKRYRAKGDHAQ